MKIKIIQISKKVTKIIVVIDKMAFLPIILKVHFFFKSLSNKNKNIIFKEN